MSDETIYTIHTDGASKGNPGHAGIGYVIEDDAGQIFRSHAEYIGLQTNNVAEYRALIAALGDAERLGAERLSIFSDSELMVKQIRGEYAVKNETLAELHGEAVGRLQRFEKTNVSHVMREKNKDADKLASDIVKRHLKAQKKQEG